jgi:pilus assembly protein CpaB
MSMLIESFTRKPALLGAVLALMVGALTYGYLRDARVTGTAPAPVPHASVLVARHDLAPGATIGADDVELRDLATEAILAGTLRAPDAAVGRYATTRIAAGEQVRSAAVSGVAPGGALAREVPEGARAVSIAVSDAIAAGGLIAPGDRVDVVAVFDQSRADRSGSALVVDDVEVLAVSAAVVGEPAPSAPAAQSKSTTNPQQITSTVALAVSPLQAQRLAVAEEFGSLRLVLRRPGDATPTGAATVDLAAITGATPVAAVAAPAAPVATPAAVGAGG